METIKAIKTRSSIKSNYIKKEISDDLIVKLLDAGMSAPTAKNSQPWEFIIIKNKEVLKKIPEISAHTTMVPSAGAGILVCGNMDQKYKDYWIQDCSAATQNILLATHDFGLGAVWTGVYPVEETVNNFIKFFDLPKNIVPFCLIALGYYKGDKLPKNKFKKEKIHWEKF